MYELYKESLRKAGVIYSTEDWHDSRFQVRQKLLKKKSVLFFMSAPLQHAGLEQGSLG